VLDLEERSDEFSADMKERLRGRFEFDPADDWNWFVPLAPDTAPVVIDIARKHGFVMASEAAAALQSMASGNQGTGAASASAATNASRSTPPRR
jgi:hypothetical protein